MIETSNALFHTLIDYDTSVFFFFNHHFSRFDEEFMELFSSKLVWIPFYVSLIYMMVKTFTWKKVLVCMAAVGIMMLLTDAMASNIIRPLFCRLRPSNPDNPISSMVNIVNGYRGGRYGFPSCHSANTWGLTFFLMFLFRNRKLNIFMIFWATMMCYSRMYLGVHYPTDLLCGMLLGLFSSYLSFQLVRYYDRKYPQEITNAEPESRFPMADIVGSITILVFFVIAFGEWYMDVNWI